MKPNLWDGRESDALDRLILADRRRTIHRGTKADRALCAGITARGRRCHAKAKPGEGYCAQHLPSEGVG